MTRNLLRYALVVLGIGLCASTAAHGMAFGKPFPEVDPGLAVSAVTLLAGSLAVLRVRCKK